MLLMTYVKTGDDETWPFRQHRLRSYWRLGRRFSSQTELARLQRFCSEPGSGSVSQTWLLTVVRVGFVRDAVILMVRVPARPSRAKVISIPSARRGVCARR